MEFPSAIRERISELSEEYDIKTLIRAAERISEGYRSEQGFSASSREEIIAYASVRMPATFAAVSRALELSLEVFGGKISTVLDVGAGTGAGAIAADLLTDCERITCLERDGDMLSLGEEFCGLVGAPTEWVKYDISDGISERAELVVCSYCLNELNGKTLRETLERLANSTEKILVIVERGTPKAFGEIKEIRKTLEAFGMKVLAPCTFSGECKLPQKDWCHFTARASRTALHRKLKNADAPYEDEKFCFLAMTREENPVENSARVLRHPIIGSGKITLELCSADGISTKLITRKTPLFKQARKAKTGDLFPMEK